MIEFMRGTWTPLSTTAIPVGEDDVEQGRVLAVAVAEKVLRLASGVLDVHGEVAGGLSHPRRGRVGGGAEDANPAGGVFDDGRAVQSRAGQGHGFEEIRGADSLALAPQ